jgi:hypothetical protein
MRGDPNKHVPVCQGQLLFCPEDGCSTFLPNVRQYKVSPKRSNPHSHCCENLNSQARCTSAHNGIFHCRIKLNVLDTAADCVASDRSVI